MIAARYPEVGTRFRLINDVDRFPFFVAKSGSIGTVVEVNDGMIFTKMDEIIPGCEGWDNIIHWPFVGEFWEEAEIL